MKETKTHKQLIKNNKFCLYNQSLVQQTEKPKNQEKQVSEPHGCTGWHVFFIMTNLVGTVAHFENSSQKAHHNPSLSDND